MDFDVGILVDGLSVMMLFVVTFISLLVHVYSTDYVHGDIRYTHFFAFLSLFTASMLMLVISATTVQFITSWELVGVCSFVLIGHWWEEQKNSDAALKAFITNRVGDIGLLIGMITLFFTAGRGETFNIRAIDIAAASGTVSHTALLVASLCLLAAVMSKSGQFFLHTWLPDAMAGPTPVSALIHAATMVVAGIFMVARLYPVFFNGFAIARQLDQPAGVGRRHHRAGRRLARLRPGGHQEGARLLDGLPARLHGAGARRGGVDGRAVPPLHPRLLQGLPVPRAPVRSATPATTAST